MKKRHYLLIAFTVIAIVFFQPLIVLLGGLTLIIGVAALIYADLRPQAQDACEAKIAHLLIQLRTSLRRPPQALEATSPKTVKPRRIRRFIPGRRRNRDEPDPTSAGSGAAPVDRDHDTSSRDGKLYSAATPDL